MITLEYIENLWKVYFQDTADIKGLDAWTIVYMAKDGDRLLVSLANPFEEKHQDIFVNKVTNEELKTFIQLYKERFMEQLNLRFGLFKPDTSKVLTEYPQWDLFYQAWINDDPKLVQLNFPLLFDFPTEDEYKAMKLKGADFSGYRRLLVVVYQYRKAKFHKIFVEDVDDNSFETIRLQMIDLFNKSLPSLILSNAWELENA